MKNYGKFTIGLISVWFLLALFASAAHLFENNANRIGIAVAIAAVAPLLLFRCGSQLLRTFENSPCL
jgi:hypothetical protein